MASGKFRNQHVDRTLFETGLHVNKGFLGHVTEIHNAGFVLALPCGNSRQISYSPELRPEKINQWKFVVNKCYSSSLKLRVIGAVQQSEQHWYLTPSSLLLRQPGLIRADEIRIYESFCGGFGGFARAVEFINRNTAQRPFKHLGGFDIDQAAIGTYNRNHGVKAECADIHCKELWERMADLEIGVLTITAPCVSFSLAGRQDGWAAPGGVAFSLMISVAALLGIQVLIIENVANLDEDEAFKKGLHDRLRSNGYSCILRHQFNTTKFRPVHRNRVILIAYFEGPLIGQLEDWKLTPVVDSSPHIRCHSSPHIRCQDPFLMQLPGDLMHDAVIEPYDLTEYANLKRFPRSYIKEFRHYDGCDPSRCSCQNDIRNLQFRTWKGNEHLSAGTIMASYTKQHRLPGIILGQIVCDSGTFRYLHPLEALVNTGITDSVVLPRELHLSARIVGNQISEFHAIIALSIILQAWPLRAMNHAFHFDIANLLVRWQRQCICSESICVQFDEEWIRVSSRNTHIEPMDIAPACVFHPEVSPTLPFRIGGHTQQQTDVSEPTLEDDLCIMLAEHINDTRKTVPIPDTMKHLSSKVCRMWQTTQDGPAVAQDEMTFYLQQVAARCNLDNFGAWSCSQLLRKEIIDALAWRNAKQGKIVALLVNQHWRILYIDFTSSVLQMHWFYSYRTGNADVLISNAFKSAIERAAKSPVEQTTHLGVGTYGWCGWDALEACLNYHVTRVFPHEVRIQPISFQAFAPCVDWDDYHERMQHHLAETQELSLVLRTLWFQEIMLSDNYTIDGNMLGFGDEKTQKGRIAGLLIAKGHEAGEAIRVADAIGRIDLPQKEANAINSKKQSVSYPAILHFCEAHDIAITSQKNVAISKLQKFWRSKSQKKTEKLDLAMLVIPSGTFSVGDTPVEVNRIWTPTSVGVSLATPEQLEPYLQQGQRLTSKCNSVILAESIEVKEPFQSDSHIIRASDHWGGSALVRIQMIHLGDVKATRSPIKEVTVSADASTEIIVSVHRHLWTEDQWTQLIKGPLKMLLMNLFGDTKPDLQHVGFRRWALRRAKSIPEKADFFSILLTIKTDLLHSWLRFSGMTGPPVFNFTQASWGQ